MSQVASRSNQSLRYHELKTVPIGYYLTSTNHITSPHVLKEHVVLHSGVHVTKSDRNRVQMWRCDHNRETKYYDVIHTLRYTDNHIDDAYYARYTDSSKESCFKVYQDLINE